MSGNHAPKTTPAQDAADQAAKDKAAAEAKAAADKVAADKAWQAKLGGSYNSAVEEAKKYFADRGVDPSAYVGDIVAAANKAKGLVPDNAATPDTYFNGIADKVFNDRQDLLRSNSVKSIDKFAPTNFETQKIADTADDPILAAINGEQRQTAERYLDNLVKRGLINNNGRAAAEADLTRQSDVAMGKLGEFGQAALTEGRTKIGNLANSGRSAASGLNLGDSFDPNRYSTDINNALSEFFNGLGSNIRSRVGSDLYSIGNLPNVAGAGQGAQNTKFDPNALAGIFDEPPLTPQTNNLTSF